MSDLHYLDITDIARLIRERAISPVMLTEHMLARIAALDPQLHSYAHVAVEAALRDAAKAEAALAEGRPIGPLHGVPIAVKDLFWTADMPTAAGMPIHRDFLAPTDATVVRRLRVAGAVILGKLQMTEGAFAIHHPSIAEPLNPWNVAHWAGASSSGSGIATAAGLCFGALGSDTGGSIRFPCAANGLTGIKPTWGRVSRHGTFELAASLDHIGPMARSAADAALLLSIIAGHDPLDRTSLPDNGFTFDDSAFGIAELRIGVDPAWNANGSDDATLAMIDEAAAVFVSLGADLRQMRLPEARAVSESWEAAAGSEAAIAHAATYPGRAAEYGPALARLIDIGRGLPPADRQRILIDRMALRGALDRTFADVDLLLLPVQPYAAPSLEQLGALAHDPEANSRLIQYTSPFNFTGHPAISLPGGVTADGLPLGFQLVAAHGSEELLSAVGCAFQRETDWHRRRARP